MSRRYSPTRRLTVIALGAATDVASALLLDPGAADRIEIEAVGFDGWPRGGDPWNVKNDPAAWRAILASPVPLVIGPVATCLRHLTLDRAGAEEKTRGGGAAGDALRSALQGWLEREADLCRKTTGRKAWPIWDLIIPARILGYTQQQVVPRPRLRSDLSFDLEETTGVMRWITAIDERKLWEDLNRRLRRWARERAGG
jgi:inosine-uridine nucleoside N-ribohydrolase